MTVHLICLLVSVWHDAGYVLYWPECGKMLVMWCIGQGVADAKVVSQLIICPQSAFGVITYQSVQALIISERKQKYPISCQYK